MSDIKLSGIVISAAPMGDKDVRAVLLSREIGKVTVLVKGGLSPKSKWRSIAQPFACGNFVLSKGTTFYYIKEAELGDSLYELRTDLDRLAWASVMMEAAERFSLDGVENRELVNLLVRGLMAMARGGVNPPEAVAAAFIFRLLADAGFQGECDVCRYCGRKVGGGEDGLPGEAWGFRPEDGSVVCPVCEKMHPTGYLLSPQALGFWNRILEAEEKEIFSVPAFPQTFTELKRSATAFLEFQSEQRFRSLEFIRSIGG